MKKKSSSNYATTNSPKVRRRAASPKTVRIHFGRTDWQQLNRAANTGHNLNHAAPIRNSSNDFRQMPLSSNDRYFLKRLTVDIDLTREPVETVLTALDLIAVDAPIDDSDIHAATGVSQPQFIDNQGIGPQFLMTKSLAVEGRSDVRIRGGGWAIHRRLVSRVYPVPFGKSRNGNRGESPSLDHICGNLGYIGNTEFFRSHRAMSHRRMLFARTIEVFEDKNHHDLKYIVRL